MDSVLGSFALGVGRKFGGGKSPEGPERFSEGRASRSEARTSRASRGTSYITSSDGSASDSSAGESAAGEEGSGNEALPPRRRRSAVVVRWFLGVANLVLLVLAAAMVLQVQRFLRMGMSVSATRQFSVSLNDTAVPTTHAYGLTMLKSAADIGEVVILANDGGRTFALDTGTAIYNGIITAHEILVVGAHACSVESVDELEPPSLRLGILATRCLLGVEDTQSCVEGCLVLGGGWNESVLAESYSITEYFRTKNSLGFGVTYAEQHVTNVQLIRQDTLVLESTLSATSQSNSNRNLGRWQDVAVVLVSGLAFNLVVRLLCVSVIVHGVQLRTSRVTVYADLAGGLFTSPSLAFGTFISFVVIGSHCFLFIESSQFPIPLFVHAFITTIITACVCSFITVIGATTMRMSGSGVFLVCLGARFWTLDISRARAADAVHGLGQVLVRQCQAFTFDEAGATLSTETLDCVVADGAGLSGLEVVSKVWSETILVALGLLVAIEVLLSGCVHAKKAMTQAASSPVAPSSSTVSDKINHALKKRRKRRKLALSHYEQCLLLTNHGRSVFSSAWATPIVVGSKKYYHVSSMVEDNAVLWGPLLLRLSWYPVAAALAIVMGKSRTVEWLVHHQFYLGVLERPGRLVARSLSLHNVPRFVHEEFDYEAMSLGLSAQPVD